MLTSGISNWSFQKSRNNWRLNEFYSQRGLERVPDRNDLEKIAIAIKNNTSVLSTLFLRIAFKVELRLLPEPGGVSGSTKIPNSSDSQKHNYFFSALWIESKGAFLEWHLPQQQKWVVICKIVRGFYCVHWYIPLFFLFATVEV